MTSTPCKSLKNDGTPCRGNGLDQLDGYCIAHAPADKAWQWRSRGGKASSAAARADKRIPDRLRRAIEKLSTGMDQVLEGKLAPAAARLLSCTENFLTQSLVNSRELSCISRTCAPAFATPPSAAKGPPARPILARRRDARGLRQPPVCPVAPKIFLPNLTHSLVISRVTLLHVPYLSTPPSAPKMPLTSIPFATGTLQANQTTVSWPSRLPLPNPQYPIQRPTCSFPLARACTTV